MQDRDFTKVDIEKVDLPANHPFAMKKQVGCNVVPQILRLRTPH